MSDIGGSLEKLSQWINKMERKEKEKEKGRGKGKGKEKEKEKEKETEKKESLSLQPMNHLVPRNAKIKF